ncbi:MAG: cytochrome c maturation protein CcmE [Coriobacteriia bacterium]|nr:cytochrome c maturation protein CcmE [Coriobacteriia bacterium]
MNKRARMRLIGVTAIILIVIAVLVVTLGNKQSAVSSTIAQVKSDAKNGGRVKVEGAVVAGSWNKQSNPMKFTIKQESDTAGTGPTLKVVYTGTAPNTFGDGVVAVVTGTLDGNGVVQANEMITKCPSKYSSAVGAIPVGELNKGTSMAGKPNLQVSGYVKPGSLGSATAAQRFFLASKADGSDPAVAVKFTGGLPDTVKDGAQVVVTGTLGTDNVFTATSVALAQGQ